MFFRTLKFNSPLWCQMVPSVFLCKIIYLLSLQLISHYKNMFSLSAERSWNFFQQSSYWRNNLLWPMGSNGIFISLHLRLKTEKILWNMCIWGPNFAEAKGSNILVTYIFWRALIWSELSFLCDFSMEIK